jgi:hypothetical protein
VIDVIPVIAETAATVVAGTPLRFVFCLDIGNGKCSGSGPTPRVISLFSLADSLSIVFAVIGCAKPDDVRFAKPILSAVFNQRITRFEILSLA